MARSCRGSPVATTCQHLPFTAQSRQQSTGHAQPCVTGSSIQGRPSLCPVTLHQTGRRRVQKASVALRDLEQKGWALRLARADSC